MAVEILILSGARQGERVVLNGPEFRVGTDPGCEVYFDPEHDPAAKGRAAMFRLEGDSWSLLPTEVGELSVNQRAVAGPTVLRSGDVMRLSPRGPDFCFRLSSPPAWPAAAAPAEIPQHKLVSSSLAATAPGVPEQRVAAESKGRGPRSSIPVTRA